MVKDDTLMKDNEVISEQQQYVYGAPKHSIHTDLNNKISNLNINNSKKEEKEPKKDSSNLNRVVAATAAADDHHHHDIDNVKLQIESQANNNMPNNGESNSILLRSLEDLDAIVQNDEDDDKNNSFIIEEKCFIGFIPGQPDNVFAFPNGKDVLDDSLFHNKHSSVDNGTNVGNNIIPDTIYGEICDRNEDANPPPLPPKHLPHPSITLNHGINNLIGEYETIYNDECDNNYDVNLDTTQQEVGKYSIRKLDDDSILNVKLQVECGNSTGNLNGIHINIRLSIKLIQNINFGLLM